MLIQETVRNKTKYYTYNDFCVIENKITTEEEREKYSMNPNWEYVSTQDVIKK